MPLIKAFSGIHPAADIADKVVLQVEGISIERAKEIRQANPLSYVNMLVPKIDNPYLRGSKKELAYKKINENFDDFIDRDILVRDSEPAVYVYRVTANGIVQTGIWTVTSIDDYLNNTVKKHELTRADREKGLIDYLQQTGIDANPVLVTYRADAMIDGFITEIMSRKPLLDFTIADAGHTLWKIEAAGEIEALITSFSQLNETYIADGHHRAAAACSAGIERRKLNLKHRGDEEYNFFSTVYIPANQLKILEFNRMVKDVSGLNPADLIARVSENFFVQLVQNSQPCRPQSDHQFGMYFNKAWYLLEAKPETYQAADAVNCLDVSILQTYILDRILGIENPQTDPRLHFSGGLTPVEELVALVDNGTYAIAFTLFPTRIDQLMAVADAGEVMPPKSTWFEPKFQAGLLIHHII